MNRAELADALLKGLLKLEHDGDLVITHAMQAVVADRLCSHIIHTWARQSLDLEPDELIIEDMLSAVPHYLQDQFDLSAPDAKAITKQFIQSLENGRTIRELAELLSHQGYQEIGKGAYFCIHLKRGEYYSMDYLDWRAKLCSR